MQKQMQPAHMLQALTACLIPAAETMSESGLMIAQSTHARFLRHNDPLPPGAGTSSRKRPGRRVPVRGANPYRDTARPTARWPEEKLITAVVPMLICPVEGQVDFRFSDYSVHLQPGHFCLIPLDVPRTDGSDSHIEGRGENAKCDLFWLRPREGALECWICHSHGAEHHGGTIGRPIYVQYQDAISHFTTLTQEVQERALGWEKISRNLLVILLTVLQRKIQTNQFYGAGQSAAQTLPDSTLAHDFLPFARRYIQEHLHEPLTIERVSRATYVSRTYFTTQFRRQSGQSFTEYLTRCRVERATNLLRDTDWSVQAVASLVGVTPAHLRELFESHVGLSPREFRRQVQQATEHTVDGQE